jgi:hypothetical protein
MDKKIKKMDRFRPDWGLGATFDALSVPQHELNRDPAAEQQHQPTPAAQHPTIFPIFVLLEWIQSRMSSDLLSKYD